MSDSLIEAEDAPRSALAGVAAAAAADAAVAADDAGVDGDRAPSAAQIRLRVEEGMRRAADGGALPQKRYFRQRAHINPLSFTQAYML